MSFGDILLCWVCQYPNPKGPPPFQTVGEFVHYTLSDVSTNILSMKENGPLNIPFQQPDPEVINHCCFDTGAVRIGLTCAALKDILSL